MTVPNTPTQPTPPTDDVLANLQRRLAECHDPNNVPGLSFNQRREREEARHALAQRVNAARVAKATIDTRDPKIAAVTKWHGHETAWRKQCTDELTDLPTCAADRTREQEQRARQLMFAIENLDSGCAYMNGAAVLSPFLAEWIKATYQPAWDGPRDPWSVGFGSIGQAKELLASLQRERDDAQRRLDDALREERVDAATVNISSDAVTT